jgi:hypothetical protein
MRMRFVFLLVLPLLLTPTAASGDGGPAPGAVTGWDGVLSARGGVRYVAIPSERSTTVAAVEVHGGRILEYRFVRGLYGVPLVAYDGTTGGLSADGSTLVLSSFVGPLQVGQISRFAVVSPSRHLKTMKRIVLRGTFSYDAISPSGRYMYLIEYAQSGTAVTYRVRAYDLARGRLLAGSIVDRREPDEKMQGAPVTRATSADGGWAYTLYARPSGKAFVHALDTRRRAAFCIDLPFGGDQQALNGLRMRVERGRVTVREASGPVAAIDRKSFKVESYRAP